MKNMSYRNVSVKWYLIYSMMNDEKIYQMSNSDHEVIRSHILKKKNWQFGFDDTIFYNYFDISFTMRTIL